MVLSVWMTPVMVMSPIGNFRHILAKFVYERAQSRFLCNNGVDNSNGVDATDYLKNAFEFGYRIIQDALRESQSKKLPILGDFWGNTVSKNRKDWEDYHNIAEIIDGLTYQKLILIKIINDGFDDINGLQDKITNPFICLEINQLQQIGIWKIDGVLLGTDVTAAIPINRIQKTTFCSELTKLLSLDENIPEADILALKQKMYFNVNNIALDTITKDNLSQPVDSMTDSEIEKAWNKK